jgi:hypothetical protein
VLYFLLTKCIACCILHEVHAVPFYRSYRKGQVSNRGSSGALATNEPSAGATYDPLIGRKVWTRWPDDNHFYEAVITDYNRVEVRFNVDYTVYK